MIASFNPLSGEIWPFWTHSVADLNHNTPRVWPGPVPLPSSNMIKTFEPAAPGPGKIFLFLSLLIFIPATVLGF